MRLPLLHWTRAHRAATIECYADPFADDARRALAMAEAEAKRFRHGYIGTEHILLGLTHDADSAAGRALSALGVEIDRPCAAIEHIIGRGSRDMLGEIGLTPRAKEMIELAVREAKRERADLVGNEHLLLGLVREGEGVAAGVLEAIGVNERRVRTAIAHVTHGGPLPERVPPRRPLPCADQPLRDALAILDGEARHADRTGKTERAEQLRDLAARLRAILDGNAQSTDDDAAGERG